MMSGSINVPFHSSFALSHQRRDEFFFGMEGVFIFSSKFWHHQRSQLPSSLWGQANSMFGMISVGAKIYVIF